jgi:hypothetical protein
MKKLLPLLPLAVLAVGCSNSGGDVPIETMPKSTASSNDPSKNPIQASPNIPQQAKDAMAGKGK